MACPTDPLNSAETEALYPPGSAPQIRTHKLSSLCSYGLTPQIVSAALKQILCQIFADPRNIMNGLLRDYITREGPWKEGNDDSGLYIETIANWRPELTQARPAIIIKDGDWVFDRRGIGNQLGWDIRSGENFYGGFWNCSHAIFAIGGPGAGGETKILATEVGKQLQYFSQLIADQFEAHRFTVAKLGAMGSLAESPEHYVAPIDIAYVVNENWVTQAEAPRLKRIEFRAASLGI